MKVELEEIIDFIKDFAVAKLERHHGKVISSTYIIDKISGDFAIELIKELRKCYAEKP